MNENKITGMLGDIRCTMFDILETFSDEQKELIYLIFGLCADECVCDSAYEDTLDNISKFIKTLTIEQKKFIYLTLIACFEDSNLILDI